MSGIGNGVAPYVRLGPNRLRILTGERPMEITDPFLRLSRGDCKDIYRTPRVTIEALVEQREMVVLEHPLDCQW